MQTTDDMAGRRDAGRDMRWQILAAGACWIFGLAIVVNVQLGGEAVWFWYATLLHRGVHLYRDMHFVLQPLYVLETDAWMRIAGVRCLAYEGLALVHVAVFCAGLLLALRESRWPDWQKALLLAGCFFAVIRFDGYRFDDFHIVADIFYVYAMVLLLGLARVVERRAVWGLAAGLGVLCGLAVTNRSTDGGLLMAASGVAVLAVARRRRVEAAAVFAVAAALTWVVVVRLTGDSWQDYWRYAVAQAGSAKGGGGHVLHGPVTALLDTFARLRHGGKRELLAVAALGGCGFLVWRFWRRDARWVVGVEMALAVLLAGVRAGMWREMLQGSLLGAVNTVLQPAVYGLCVWVAVRALRRRGGWDAREAVVLVPLASLVSAALSQSTGTSNSTNSAAFLILLLAVVVENRGGWVTASVVAVVALAGVGVASYKVRHPYRWGMAESPAMFQGRHWFRHPLYGPMYMEDGLLGFVAPLCGEMGSGGVAERPELLSIPFPYVNYFCGAAPWGNYVQTWYDTVTPADVDGLMERLESAPPEWVLYQRQPERIVAHEMEYQHGQASAHRRLDEMMMRKLAEGQWTLVEKKRYLEGDGWYLMRTRP